MSSREIFKYYWNPIIFLFSTFVTFVFACLIRHWEPSGVIAGSIWQNIGHILIMAMVVMFGLWLLFIVCIAWLAGITSCLYGLVKYYKTKEKSSLQYCWSASCVAVIYGISWLMFIYGYIPNE
jgi:hypothetical protein